MPKISFLSDIHSDVEAFEAVLADVKAQGITKIVWLGDLIRVEYDVDKTIARFKSTPISTRRSVTD